MKCQLAVAVVTSMLFVAVDVAARPPAPEPPQQYPVMEVIAKKVIQKYHASSCKQLWAEKGQAPTVEQLHQQDKAVQMLRQDAAMRKAFLDIVAAPIANKMFECGMIP
jgi:hypothetical protein